MTFPVSKMSKITSKFVRGRRFLAREDGVAVLEFVVVFPVMFLMMSAYFEVGWHSTRAIMLERGLDIAARDVRLGIGDLSHDGIKAKVCEHAAIIAKCERDLILELVEMDLAADYPRNAPNCIDRASEIEPTITFSGTGRDKIVFLRACVIVDPILPGIGIGLGLRENQPGASRGSPSNGYQISAHTAFMNEP